MSTASKAVENQTPSRPNFPPADPSRLPNINYDAHPAYGKLYFHPGLAFRLKAQLLFWSNFAFVFLKWLIDYDNLPLLTRHREGRSLPGFIRIALPYMAMLVRVKTRRLLQWVSGKSQSAVPLNSVYTALVRDGIAAIFLSDDEKKLLHTVSRDALDRLRARRATEAGGKREFEDSRLRTSRETDADLYAMVGQILARHGIMDAASAYLGQNVGVKDINPQINNLTDDFWQDQFADIKLPNSRTTYVHFDAGYRVLKLIIYLSQVDPKNGPFSYIRGSNRLKVGFWEGLVRRANDYAGLSSTSAKARKLFTALPQALRMKCALGADIPDRSPASEWIIANEWYVTSQNGDAVLFDPFGLHRGGLVTEGERVVLTIVIGVVD